MINEKELQALAEREYPMPEHGELRQFICYGNRKGFIRGIQLCQSLTWTKEKPPGDKECVFVSVKLDGVKSSFIVWRLMIFIDGSRCVFVSPYNGEWVPYETLTADYYLILLGMQGE